MPRVYKRGQKWGVDYTELDGRRVRKVVADHKKVAQVVLADITGRIERQRWGLPGKSKKTVSQFFDEFISLVKLEKAPRTTAWYEHKLRRFCASLGKKLLHSITGKSIEDFKAERLKEASASTVGGDLRALNVFFNRAVRWGYREKNPCRGIPKPRMVAKNPPRFLSGPEAQRFLLAAEDSPVHPMIATALYGGLRFEELTRLEWQDIDFRQRLLSIKSKEEGHTKSHRARAIPLHPALKSILQPLRRRDGHCFETRSGKRTHSAYKTFFRPVIKASGLKNIGWHTLRHTFASHLVMAGVDLTTVKGLLGHSSITTTMIYAHLAPEHLRSAVERLTYRR